MAQSVASKVVNAGVSDGKGRLVGTLYKVYPEAHVSPTAHSVWSWSTRDGETYGATKVTQHATLADALAAVDRKAAEATKRNRAKFGKSVAA